MKFTLNAARDGDMMTAIEIEAIDEEHAQQQAIVLICAEFRLDAANYDEWYELVADLDGVDLARWAADCEPLAERAVPSEITALVEYAAAAPASDPGEGCWESLDTTYGCGARAEEYQAAKLIRAALVVLGFAAPAGVALCPGCSRDDDGEGHDPDCSLGEPNDEEDA